VKEPPKPELVPRPPDELEHADDPPVVARLVVEIRSDGSRTIARGAAWDAQRGERVAIEARGDSPLQLALALARALTQLPRGLVQRGARPPRSLNTGARSAVRRLLGRRPPK
jgi:hypothetical protein